MRDDRGAQALWLNLVMRGRSAEGWLIFEVPPTGRVLLSYSGNMLLDEEPVFEVVLQDN